MLEEPVAVTDERQSIHEVVECESVRDGRVIDMPPEDVVSLGATLEKLDLALEPWIANVVFTCCRFGERYRRGDED